MAGESPYSIIPPPLQTQMLGQDGLVTFAWANFFQKLFDSSVFAQKSSQTWSNWDPSPRGDGGMSLIVTSLSANYWNLWGLCQIDLQFTCDLAGPPSNRILFNPPVTPADLNAILTATILDPSGSPGTAFFFGGGLAIGKDDASDFNIGDGVNIRVTGAYHAAF